MHPLLAAFYLLLTMTAIGSTYAASSQLLRAALMVAVAGLPITALAMVFAFARTPHPVVAMLAAASVAVTYALRATEAPAWGNDGVSFNFAKLAYLAACASGVAGIITAVRP